MQTHVNWSFQLLAGLLQILTTFVSPAWETEVYLSFPLMKISTGQI